MNGILRNLHRYVFWLLISAVFWSWVSLLAVDAPADRKLVLYAEVPGLERKALEAALEKDLPEHIRFVDANAFMDDMFSPSGVTAGDIFIVSADRAEQFLPSFAPLEGEAFGDAPLYVSDGTAYGVCVYDEAAGIRVGTEYLTYAPGQTYYLFFNAGSGHIAPWNDSGDDAAIRAAGTLLTLP